MWIKIKYVIRIFALGIIVYVAWIVKYLTEEFALRTHTSTGRTCGKENRNLKIPASIHQIYYPIKSPNLDINYQMKMKSWKTFHFNYTHALWNESAVIDLIKKDHPDLLPVYRSYGHWVQRIDVARYVILYHYGGWYVDLDLMCKRRLDDLAGVMLKSNKSVVVATEISLGLANDFIGITPRHPFMKSFIDWLPFSNQWFFIQHARIMLSTGPTFLWGRYLNYPCRDEILVLTLNNLAKYVDRFYDGTWMGKDSHIISYLLYHRKRVLIIALFVLSAIAILCASKTCQNNCVK